MNIEIIDNLIKINEKQIKFKNNVDKVLEFGSIFVVLLMEDDIPDNNIMAVNKKGTNLWNISDIIRLPYDEAYISLSKESSTEASVISYNGVKTVFDVFTQKIVNKQITK